MEEIKVGEYCRYDDGTIIKVVEEEESLYNYLLKNKKGLFKHSPNIIDLIEVGDYVNGEIIDQIQNDRNPKLIWHLSSYGDDDMAFKNEDIETVATKEMMESISYKVKEIKNEKI